MIGPREREQTSRRSPYNVVHLTLPDSEEEAGRRLRAWREDGILVGDEEPAFWALSQDYVGPDGVARTRTGLVASLGGEPYETGSSSRTSGRTAARRRAGCGSCATTQTQLEPIFLLYEGRPRSASPTARRTSRSKAPGSGGCRPMGSPRRSPTGSS